MLNKKILITTYYYYPDNSPRAFRITALAKILVMQGYDVTVVTNTNHNFSEYNLENGINVVSLTYHGEAPQEKPLSIAKVNTKQTLIGKAFSIMKTAIRKGLLYLLPDGHLLPFAFKLSRFLKKMDLNEFDIVISNANPFIVHLGTAFSLRDYKGVSIAETGDPHYYNHYKLAFYQKNIEQWVLNKFTYITVPVQRAIADYAFFNSQDKVRVIPHGFFFDEVKLSQYKPSNTVNFAFAGRLYEEIRNPTEFLNCLVSKYHHASFVFHIYTDLRNKETNDLLSPYIKLLGDKLQVHGMLPRTECIKVLSSMDFLVNFENDTLNQVPSKLVDYTLAKRPILSVNNAFDNRNEFSQYMEYDYTANKEIDISAFDIKSVCNKFESLF